MRAYTGILVLPCDQDGSVFLFLYLKLLSRVALKRLKFLTAIIGVSLQNFCEQAIMCKFFGNDDVKNKHRPLKNLAVAARLLCYACCHYWQIMQSFNDNSSFVNLGSCFFKSNQIYMPRTMRSNAMVILLYLWLVWKLIST